jgi:hypothetical protein
MRAAAHGWKKPGGGGPSVAVGKEFLHADERKRKGARSKEQVHDRKQEMDSWASGGGKHDRRPDPNRVNADRRKRPSYARPDT